MVYCSVCTSVHGAWTSKKVNAIDLGVGKRRGQNLMAGKKVLQCACMHRWYSLCATEWYTAAACTGHMIRLEGVI